MSIDNFNQIADIIRPRVDSYDDFFFLQIIRRRKDPGNDDMNSDNIIVHFMEIPSADYLLEKKNRIIDICVRNNARAYIHLNKRSRKQIALKMLAELAARVSDNDYYVKNIYTSCCGKFTSEKQKLWLIDVDYDNFSEGTVDDVELEQFVTSLILETGKEPVVHRIQTNSGYHLICNSFNSSSYRLKYDYALHKENPTVLYIP